MNFISSRRISFLKELDILMMTVTYQSLELASFHSRCMYVCMYVTHTVETDITKLINICHLNPNCELPILLLAW